MEDIIIWSDDFQNGGEIPSRHTCDSRDISPHITWTKIHPDTRSITLIMEDPDAPGGTFVHWTIYNIPPYISTLPAGIPEVPDLSAWPLAGSGFQGITDFGKIGYGGPCPPPGKYHRYFFKIYALDTRLDLPSGASKRDIERSMVDHIIAKGELIGLYKR